VVVVVVVVVVAVVVVVPVAQGVRHQGSLHLGWALVKLEVVVPFQNREWVQVEGEPLPVVLLGVMMWSVVAVI
jgi:hypothetical protein